MKKYLVFQRSQNRAIIKTKPDRYSPEISREMLKKRGVVVVEGMANAGKSRWINRLDEEAKNIWQGRAVIKINARSPMSEIVEIIGTEGEKLYNKINAVKKWAEEKRPVLLLDDAHILTGRKAEMIKQLIINAYAVVLTCINVNQLPTAIRFIVFGRSPQIVRLSSKVSYDATQWLIWLMVVVAVATGSWEIAAVLGGAGILSRGRGASKST